MPKIFDNFKYSSTKFLDNRQNWKSIEELRANSESILMPNGFEVCINGTWYELSTTNERDTSTYVWKERVIEVSDVLWENVTEKPFETLNSTFFVKDENNALSITNRVMDKNTYVDTDTGIIKKSNESAKITGVESADALTYYGKNNNGEIGFHLVQDSMTSDMTTDDINTFINELLQ